MQLHTHGVCSQVASALADKFPWDDYRSFVDIGAAEGTLAICVAETHVHLFGGGFDSPGMQRNFEALIKQHHLEHRLRFFPGHICRDTLPSADVLICNHVLRQENSTTTKDLLRNIYKALTDEGALIVNETLDETAAFVTHSRGSFRTPQAQWIRALREAGFRDVDIRHLVGLDFMVIGIK